MAGLIGLAAASLSLAMAFAWVIQRRTGQSGWIDTIWSLAVGFTGVIALLLQGPLIQGPLMGRRLVVLGFIALWSLRLASHIARRTQGAGDDPRYAALMAEWGAAAPRRLLLFLQAQAAAGLVLVVAVLLAAANPAPFPGFPSLPGVLIALAGIIGEAVADAQLTRWKRLKIVNGICDTGLWKHSRHPNYFFEWLFWAGIALIALDHAGGFPAGLLALAAPAMIYVLLRYGSGIPHLEAHMRRTRGAAFERYCAVTPPFFPRLWG
jgi:steroid 5-alpha reductase family enzyme